MRMQKSSWLAWGPPTDIQKTTLTLKNNLSVAIFAQSRKLLKKNLEVTGVGVSVENSRAFASAEAKKKSESEVFERITLVQKLALHENRQIGSRLRQGFSNGYACGNNQAFARASAVNEVRERHSVLWHWYSGNPPKSIEDHASRKSMEFLNFCKGWNWNLYYFGNDTVGVVGLPIGKHSNLVLCGFSSNSDFNLSVRKAAIEAFQRWFFLRDLKVFPSQIKVKPKPEFHSEVFATRLGKSVFESWLSGHAGWRGVYDLELRRFPQILKKEDVRTEEVDLVSHQGRDYHIWKAFSENGLAPKFGLPAGIDEIVGSYISTKVKSPEFRKALEAGLIHPIA